MIGSQQPTLFVTAPPEVEQSVGKTSTYLHKLCIFTYTRTSIHNVRTYIDTPPYMCKIFAKHYLQKLASLGFVMPGHPETSRLWHDGDIIGDPRSVPWSQLEPPCLPKA